MVKLASQVRNCLRGTKTRTVDRLAVIEEIINKVQKDLRKSHILVKVLAFIGGMHRLSWSSGALSS
jgi:hypothetical protein